MSSSLLLHPMVNSHSSFSQIHQKLLLSLLTLKSPSLWLQKPYFANFTPKSLAAHSHSLLLIPSHPPDISILEFPRAQSLDFLSIKIYFLHDFIQFHGIKYQLHTGDSQIDNSSPRRFPELHSYPNTYWISLCSWMSNSISNITYAKLHFWSPLSILLHLECSPSQ